MEVIIWFYLHSFNVVYHVYLIGCVEPSFDYRYKCHLIIKYEPFNVVLNLVWLFFFLEIVLLRSSGTLSWGFLVVSVWLWYQGPAGLIKCIWRFFLLFNFFWKCLRRIAIIFFFKWLIKFTYEAICEPLIWWLLEISWCLWFNFYSIMWSNKNLNYIQLFFKIWVLSCIE